MRLTLWDIDPAYPREYWEPKLVKGHTGRFDSCGNPASPQGRQRLSRRDHVEADLVGGKCCTWRWQGTSPERKLAEEALRESEERYRRLVEASPIPMWINKDGFITYMNPAALRTLGYRNSIRLWEGPPGTLSIPTTMDWVKERISRMMAGGKTAPLLEEKYIRLDGSIIDVEVIATPFTTSRRKSHTDSLSGHHQTQIERRGTRGAHCGFGDSKRRIGKVYLYNFARSEIAACHHQWFPQLPGEGRQSRQHGKVEE